MNNLSKKDFTEELMAILKDRLSDDYIIRIDDVTKNNGTSKIAIEICEDGSDIGGVHYIDDLYSAYTEGETLGSAADKIIGNVVATEILKVNPVTLDYIKKNTYVSLINADMNRDMLLKVPSQKVEGMNDLAAIVRVKVDINGHKGSYILSDQIFDSLDISRSDLFNIALANTDEPVVKNMSEVMAEITGMPVETFGDIPFSVVTNSDGVNGAASVMKPGFMTNMSISMGEDFYIIPSSVHEVLIIPESAMDKQSMVEIVRSVNSSVVGPEDKLSDNIYMCNHKTLEITTFGAGLDKGMDISDD